MKKTLSLLVLISTVAVLLAGCACEHDYKRTVIKDPTCGSDGTVEYKCVKCKDSYTESIVATGKHNYKGKITKEADCIHDGEKKFTCEVCGVSYTETVPPTGQHKYAEKVTREATCTKDGEITYTCNTCGDTYTESIKAEHEWKNATCTEPKTCKKCKKTSGSALGHDIDDKGICSRCSKDFSVDMTKRIGKPYSEYSELPAFYYERNSVDGIAPCWTAKNKSGKTINYYTITYHFYNAVGDEARSEITGLSTKRVRTVGPVAPNEDMYGPWDVIDYVPTCSKVVIGEVKLEYSDGTVEVGWCGYSTTREW